MLHLGLSMVTPLAMLWLVQAPAQPRTAPTVPPGRPVLERASPRVDKLLVLVRTPAEQADLPDEVMPPEDVARDEEPVGDKPAAAEERDLTGLLLWDDIVLVRLPADMSEGRPPTFSFGPGEAASVIAVDVTRRLALLRGP